ncbi:nucleoside hydrolase [Burkholderiaceae bacterium UC74_6]
MRDVIFDTDPGIDDAMALYLLARSPAIRLRAVTSIYGNAAVTTTTRNARGLAGLFGMPDLPVAAGASRALNATEEPHYPDFVHGGDGLGGMADQAGPAVPLDPRPAHQLICDMVNAEPGKITLIAVGPMTNLALALRHDPSIAGKVKEVIIMGGAFGMNGHSGNVTPVAEANIIADPLAADEVLTANWPVAIIGLDVTHEVVMSEKHLAKLRGRGGKVGDFFWHISRHYQGFYHRVAGIEGIYCHDASAIAYAIDDSIFKTRLGPVRVVQEGIAKGQTIQDHRYLGHNNATAWSDKPAQKVCIGVDAGRVLSLFDAAFD